MTWAFVVAQARVILGAGSRDLVGRRDRRRARELGTMSGEQPVIDYANLPTPTDGFVVTMFITAGRRHR